MDQANHQNDNIKENAPAQDDVWSHLDSRRILAHTSHDLRTHLNTVLGLTSLAKAQSDDKEYIEYCLEKIDVSAHAVLDMVNDILYLTRLDSRDMLHTESVNVAEMFTSIAETAKAMADEKRISFVFAMNIGDKQDVMADGNRVRQVLNNLLSNAVKFTPRYGRVEFSMGQLSADEDKLQLEFIVKDSGIGIAEEIQDKIFQPFIKEYSGNTTVYGGMGVGLAMCKRIVDLMGGKIDFYSVKGEGSTFNVRWTFDLDKKAVQKTDAGHKDLRFNGETVLLAEDNEINCEIVKRLLQKQGLKVETAENGQVALSKFMINAPGTFDIILMDVRMPYMDGLTATQRIRASGKSDAETIPILAMTANAYEADIKKSLAAGMNAHLTKPVDAKRICKAIQKALDGELNN